MSGNSETSEVPLVPLFNHWRGLAKRFHDVPTADPDGKRTTGASITSPPSPFDPAIADEAPFSIRAVNMKPYRT